MKLCMTYIIASLLLVSANSLAAAPKKPASSKNIFFCPDIKALKMDPKTRTWHVGKNWKSYDISFVEKVKGFAGAQWNGAKVGQITCVYHGTNPSAFAIQLVFHTLTQDPSKGKWSKDLGGYKNCISNNPADCPFSLNIKKQDSDIYQSIENLRNQ